MRSASLENTLSQSVVAIDFAGVGEAIKKLNRIEKGQSEEMKDEEGDNSLSNGCAGMNLK
ncbi:MAG: hypothetical protein LBJ46_07920 [Planctomycetota bacterium]|jgi:hypothetical protein|nr:hypothetical protein [Planctomycetota bacterium]